MSLNTEKNSRMTQKTSQGRGGRGSLNQTRKEGTWELAPFSRVLLSREEPTKGQPSLSIPYVMLRLASYIDLEKRLVVVRIKELLLHAVAVEVGVVAA